MKFRKVTAIVNCMVLETVEDAARHAGARGISVSTVKGFGEYANFFKRDWLTRHVKIEIYVPAERAEAIANAIVSAAHTGREGDGIVAVVPVEQVYRIRTCQPSCAGDL